MRRLAPFLVLLVFAAGCGAGKIAKPLPSGPVTGVKAQKQTNTVAAKFKSGDANAGKQVFETAGCKGCHTLKDAGATGTVGPNLDTVKPPLSKVVTQVINGGGAMPPFKGQLSDKQIADVSAYVVKATGGSPTQ